MGQTWANGQDKPSLLMHPSVVRDMPGLARSPERGPPPG